MTVKQWKNEVFQAWKNNDQDRMAELRDQKLIDSLEEEPKDINFVDVSYITEYGLTQKLSNCIRVF